MTTIKLKGQICSDMMAMMYRWFGIEVVCPSAIENALEQANGDDVVLEIASPGGTVVAGYEIYSAIKKYVGKVTAHITWACSAATFVACACDEVLISEAGVYMIHNVQGGADGDYQVMDKESKDLQAIGEGIINAYESKTSLPRDEIKRLMDESTYMSPADAIEYGFCDGLMTSAEDTSAEIDITAVAASAIPTISDEKAKVFMSVKAFIDEVGSEELAMKKIMQCKSDELQEGNEIEGINNIAQVTESPVSDIENSMKGAKAMGLQELLNENPEAKAEYEQAIAEVKANAVEAERERMKSLVAIANNVISEMLSKAKYEDIVDGKELAYKALVEGNAVAAAYMENAIAGSAESGVDSVGIGSPNTGLLEDDSNSEQAKADQMAAFINAKKGVKSNEQTK